MSKLFDKITSLGNIQVLRKHIKRWGVRVTKDVKLIWDIVLDFPVFSVASLEKKWEKHAINQTNILIQ